MIFFHKKEAEKIELGARPGSTLGILEELKKSWSGVTRNFRKYFLQFHWGELAMGRDGIRFCICQFDNNFPPPPLSKKTPRNVHASIKKVKVNKNWHEIRQMTFWNWIWYKWERKKIQQVDWSTDFCVYFVVSLWYLTVKLSFMLWHAMTLPIIFIFEYRGKFSDTLNCGK